MEEEQYQDLDTYLTHHNTFEVSQRICRDYQSRLLALDEEKYYKEVGRAFYTYGTLAAQDYRPANQAPGPRQTTQELMQIFGKGRGQACREHYTDIGLLDPEQGHYKAVYSGKSKRPNG